MQIMAARAIFCEADENVSDEQFVYMEKFSHQIPFSEYQLLQLPLLPPEFCCCSWGGRGVGEGKQSFLIVELGRVNLQVVLYSPNLNPLPWNPAPSQEVSIEFKARLKYT